QPLISRSTSDSVRYSRVRTSAFLGRRGVLTFRIWVSGDTIFKAGFGIEISAPFRLLSVKNTKYGKLQWSFIGQRLDRGRQKGPGGDRGKSSMENLRGGYLIRPRAWADTSLAIRPTGCFRRAWRIWIPNTSASTPSR